MVNSIYLDITQSEENAQRLREQTELLASIYDTVPCGIVRFSHGRDGSYRLISTNRTAILLQGYDSMEEGLADWHDGVLGNVLPQDQDLLRSCYAMLKQPGGRQDKEYRARWKDGSVHWMEGTNMVVGTTPEGDHIIQRTIVDITQRKALQVQLEREQEMYRVSMEASAAVMFEYLMDEDVFISYEPRSGMGVWRNELHNYSNILLEQEIIHPEDIPLVLDNICGGRAECFEVRCATPEGQRGVYTWYRVNCRLIVEEGKPDRVVGAIYNIHEMKSLLSENSEHLYMNQSALQAINGVYVSMFYVNLIQDSYYAVRLPDAGRKKPLPRTGRFSESLNRYILEQTDEADRERVGDMCARDWLLQEITQENEHMEAEFRLAGQEDGGSWYRLEIHLVAMEQSRPKTIIIAIRNISSEKQKELEHREEEKKAKQALEEAYAAANRANQAKSEFLSRMSHDIRTPMNAILGMAAVAEHNLDNRDKLKDCLLKIHTSGDHLLELINAVLDMSKIESGSVCLVENPFSLSGMMEEVAQIIQTDIGQKGQHLFVRLEGLVHDAVHGDMVRVKEILLNLLSNAVKYTPENGTIKVSLEEKLSSRSGVGCFEFIVEDDGIGMTQAFQEKMFTPFERAEDERVSQTQGTGLGLPITLNLVQMMNGTIQVESHLNKGTRFVVTIYLKLVMDQDKTHSQDREPPVKAPRAFRPGTRILLAEDNELNREIVKDQRRPDGAGIPIIALTANAFADDAYKAKQAGMNEHVTKPLDLDRLLETMHRWMD